MVILMDRQVSDISEPVNDTLRGNPLIAKEVEIRKGEPAWSRSCGLCEYGDDDGQYAGRCLLTGRDEGSPYALFNIKDGENIPRKLDGKEVGNYCPSWIPFEAEMS